MAWCFAPCRQPASRGAAGGARLGSADGAGGDLHHGFHRDARRRVVGHGEFDEERVVILQTRRGVIGLARAMDAVVAVQGHPLDDRGKRVAAVGLGQRHDAVHAQLRLGGLVGDDADEQRQRGRGDVVTVGEVAEERRQHARVLLGAGEELARGVLEVGAVAREFVAEPCGVRAVERGHRFQNRVGNLLRFAPGLGLVVRPAVIRARAPTVARPLALGVVKAAQRRE